MLEPVQPSPTGPQSGSFLKQWLLADLAEARRSLETLDLEPDRAIHLARRRLKRVRTLFLVVKPLAGTGHGDRAQPVKAAFQQLSGARDADAMLKAAVWLCQKAGSKAKQPALALADMVKIHVAGLHNQQAPISDIVSLLRIAEAEAASLAVETDSIALLHDALLKAYRKGRKLYHGALDAREEDDETLHDWRKQVKHRLHIGQIMEGARLGGPDFPVKDLDRLSEYLGEDHDFANLASWMCSDAYAVPSRDLAHLTVAISRRRTKLTSRALELGQELYGQKAAAFARGLKVGG